MKAPLPLNEGARLDALQQYQVLDTAPEAAFDELARLAAQICQTPMASITFIDRDRQWHKSNLGIDAVEVPRDLSFCAHTVTGNDILLVPDATRDERFSDNPAVTGEMGLRFYAGMPLVTPEGLSVGSLCVFDTKPHDIAPEQLEALRTLGRQVIAQLELRPDACGSSETLAPQSRQQRLAQRRSERMQAAAALQNANENYRGLFEATREGLLIINAQSGAIEESNAFARDLLGALQPLIGQQIWRVASLQPLCGGESKWATLRHRLRECGDLRVPEIALQMPGECEVWVEFRAHLYQVAGREIVRCNLRDITQSKLDRAALDTQERHHRVLLELSLNAVVVIDAEGLITQWNPAAETMFGHARAEVLGRDLTEIIVPPAQRAAHCAAFERHLRTGESHILGRRIEVTAMRANGSEFPVELAIARHDAADGPIFLASLRDITDRKNIQRAMQRATDELELHVIERTAELRESNAQLQLKIAEHQRAEERLGATARRLRSVLESISDAFVSLDENWCFTYVNEPARRLMGKTCEELLGREVWEGFPGARDTIFDEEWRRATRDGQPVTLESYFAPWKIWLEIHAYPSEEGLSIYFQDISARRADQFALEEAKREADAANAAKSEFLGRISHELRTPLNAILGFGQILDRQNLAPLQQESVGYILKSGAHLLELINEVLDITRVESGHVELNIEPVSIAGAVAEACAIVRPLADARAIQLRWATPDHLPSACVSADAQRFTQIMINLLSNAIKYNFEGGEVEINWRAQGKDRWFISVRDSGPGIEAAKLPRIFVPFERGDAANSGVEGTGLGLSLTSHLVEAMRGEMHVESAPGRGSTFGFDLPSAAAPATPTVCALPTVAAPAPCDETPCNYRVLCIEDNPSNLRLIELVLTTRPEISLVSAADAENGLKLARSHEPDLILLDLNLPDMHGSQVLQRLQQSAITRDIPVVVVSADATSAQIEELLNMGADEYLTKPLDMRRLLHTLDRILHPAPCAQINAEVGAKSQQMMAV